MSGCNRLGRCVAGLLLGALLLAGSPAFADPTGTIEAGLSLGFDWLDDNNQLGDAYYDDNILASGLLIGLRGGYNVTDRIGAELELRFLPTTLRRQSDLGQRTSFAPALGVRVHGLFHHPLMAGKLRVFGLVGAGFDSLLKARNFRKVDQHDYTEKDTDAVFDVGAGAKFELLPKLQLRADLRWLGTAGRNPEGSLSHAVEFHVGAAWLLGGKPADADGDGIIGDKDKCPDKAEDKDGFEDADGGPDLDYDKDGIPDKVDKCPDKPENKNGLLDDDGCPDADKDGDGIADAKDKCPDKKEDKDNFEDGDGCPEFDNDKDGIADNRDKCPNKAEDKDRHDDFDGCPDPDNDGDKVPDAQDRCPNEAETINGYKDRDGCSDVVPSPLVKAFSGPVKGISFDDAKAHLDTRSYDVLDERLKLLKEYSSIAVVVVGHVQDSGDPKADLKLSVQRAKMVAAYFINRGVSGDRVSHKGLGAAEPVAKGKSKKAVRRNMRIEMHLVVK